MCGNDALQASALQTKITPHRPEALAPGLRPVGATWLGDEIEQIGEASEASVSRGRGKDQRRPRSDSLTG